MTTLLELAERCEKASGPDRLLDAEILIALERPTYRHMQPEDAVTFPDTYEPGKIVERVDGGWYAAKDYTGSIDDAATLVPDRFMWTMDSWSRSQWSAGIWRHRGWIVTSDVDRQSRSPALALCAAALRARSSSQEPTKSGEGR